MEGGEHPSGENSARWSREEQFGVRRLGLQGNHASIPDCAADNPWGIPLYIPLTEGEKEADAIRRSAVSLRRGVADLADLTASTPARIRAVLASSLRVSLAAVESWEADGISNPKVRRRVFELIEKHEAGYVRGGRLFRA